MNDEVRAEFRSQNPEARIEEVRNQKQEPE
jgi:hypothetical protein